MNTQAKANRSQKLMSTSLSTNCVASSFACGVLVGAIWIGGSAWGGGGGASD